MIKDKIAKNVELILVIVVLYILGNVLENVLYKDNPENVFKRFYTKWGIITLGLILAFAGAYWLDKYALLLSLLIAFLACIVWMVLSKPKLVVNKNQTIILKGESK
ncbi:MAG: hypothetical protein AAB758_02460 [Patescibacteria group bacterium]